MKTKHIFKTTGAQATIDGAIIKDKSLKKLITLGFLDKKDIEPFIKDCLKQNQTRWMLNRLRWYIELADYQKNHSAKLFFLLAMAETNIKLLENRLNDNDKQAQDVIKFFDLWPNIEKQQLSKAFYKTDTLLKKHYFRLPTIINVLLNTRHRLAHGKNHYEFSFHSGTASILNYVHGEIGPMKKKRKIMYELSLTYNDFRNLMVINVIRNIKLAI